MSTTVEQIDLWRNAKEDQHLEFKEAKRQLITASYSNIVWHWQMKVAGIFSLE